MWPHTIAILIGGQSKRMGSPKHLVTLPNGKTMLEAMLEFASLISKQIVILGGDVKGYKCVQDLRKQHGPVGGIEALLHSDIDTDYLVVGCDMPYLVTKDIQPLVDCEGSAVFSFANMVLGLPIHIRANDRNACSTYLDMGGKSIRGFISKIPHTNIPLNEEQSNTFLSMNSRDDINKLSFEKWS